MVHGSSNSIRKSRSATPVIAAGLYDHQVNLDGTYYDSTLVPDFTVSESSEQIASGTKPKSLRYKANFCLHTKESFAVIGGGNQPKYGYIPAVNRNFEIRSAERYASASSLTALNTGLAAISNPTGAAVLGLGGQGYINDAFAALKPDLTSVSIPNFLLELKDIPRMFQLWKQNLQLAKNLANARLNWSYGWKPFLGDLQAMRSIIGSVYDKCVEWNRKAGSIEHRTMTFPSISETSTGSIVYPSGAHRTHYTVTVQGQVTAYLSFKTLAIPELRTMEGVLRVYLDALGFELNPRIIWDALPFSFVLDWFFDVGGWCNRFKTDTLELPIVLTDSFLQYKEEQRCESYWLRADDGTYVPRIRSASTLRTRTRFERLPIFPDMSAATAAGWKIPGVNQLINAISLATALRR